MSFSCSIVDKDSLKDCCSDLPYNIECPFVSRLVELMFGIDFDFHLYKHEDFLFLIHLGDRGYAVSASNRLHFKHISQVFKVEVLFEFLGLESIGDQHVERLMSVWEKLHSCIFTSQKANDSLILQEETHTGNFKNAFECSSKISDKIFDGCRSENWTHSAHMIDKIIDHGHRCLWEGHARHLALPSIGCVSAIPKLVCTFRHDRSRTLELLLCWC